MPLDVLITLVWDTSAGNIFCWEDVAGDNLKKDESKNFQKAKLPLLTSSG